MRLFAAIVMPLGLMALAAMTSPAAAGTLLIAQGSHADCGFAASTGDSWMTDAGGNAAGSEPSGPGCRTTERRAAIEVTPRVQVAVVFETATWVMMIGGFGLVGIGMRGRRRTVRRTDRRTGRALAGDAARRAQPRCDQPAQRIADQEAPGEVGGGERAPRPRGRWRSVRRGGPRGGVRARAAGSAARHRAARRRW